MNHCITSEFEELIGASRLESLNSHPSTVYGLDSELNIAYLNPAWFKFSEENGNNIFVDNEWSLGRNIFDAIPDVLEPFYRDLFQSALNEKEPPEISQQFEYECSSPELYRRFSMHLYPVGVDGVVVVHSLCIEELYKLPSANGVITLDEDDYIDKEGMIHQCANCRRLQNLNDKERWDWVPKYIKEPHSKTSHGVCVPCMHHYYLSGL